jgi:hypothetical protein
MIKNRFGMAIVTQDQASSSSSPHLHLQTPIHPFFFRDFNYGSAQLQLLRAEQDGGPEAVDSEQLPCRRLEKYE